MQTFDVRRRALVVGGLTQFKIGPRKMGKFERMLLKPGETVRATATVELPKDVKGNQFTFSVKQVVDNIAVGQMNYVLRLKEKAVASGKKST